MRPLDWFSSLIWAVPVLDNVIVMVHVALSVHALQQSEFSLVSLYPYCFSFWFDSGMGLSAGVSENAAKSLYYTHLTKHNSFHIDDIKLHDFKSKDISTGYLGRVDI